MSDIVPEGTGHQVHNTLPDAPLHTSQNDDMALIVHKEASYGAEMNGTSRQGAESTVKAR